MWDIPESRMELMSPELSGGFLTAEPPEALCLIFAELLYCFLEQLHLELRCCIFPFDRD